MYRSDGLLALSMTFSFLEVSSVQTSDSHAGVTPFMAAGGSQVLVAPGGSDHQQPTVFRVSSRCLSQVATASSGAETTDECVDEPDELLEQKEAAEDDDCPDDDRRSSMGPPDLGHPLLLGLVY